MKNKKATIEFRIAEPCHENWDKMTPLPGGHFCDSCEKTVVDFTEMTDNEVVRFVQKRGQHLCGRFRNDQLNKAIPLPEVPTRFKKWKAAAAVVAGLLAWNSASAQYDFPTRTIPIVISKNKKSTSQKEKTQKKESFSTVKYFSLKGIVKDKNGELLIGATILLKNNNGTSTDIDGKFELKIPADWESFEVTFSYIGYETQVIEFDQKEMTNGKIATVTMMENTATLKEIKVTASSNLYTKGYLTGGMSIVHSEAVEKEEAAPEEKKEIATISNIYPNPFISFVNVQLNIEKADRYLFHLYNLNGQLVWAKTFELVEGSQTLALDFADKHLAQGNYFLRITDGRQEIQTKKIIKVNEKGGKINAAKAAGI